MLKAIAACAAGVVVGFALRGLPTTPEGTWTSATAATRAEVRPGADPSELRTLAHRLLANADYRERFAARERLQ
jgi:hypothetical protein